MPEIAPPFNFLKSSGKTGAKSLILHIKSTLRLAWKLAVFAGETAQLLLKLTEEASTSQAQQQHFNPQLEVVISAGFSSSGYSGKKTPHILIAPSKYVFSLETNYVV